MKPNKTTFVCSLLFLVFTKDAYAYLKICNKTSQNNVVVAVAVRELATGNVMSEGWWTIKRGTCKIPIGGKLSARNRYYYYAHGTGGKPRWTGDYPFCTRAQRFTLRGDLRAKPNGSPLECRIQGTVKRNFKRIEINTENFTKDLVN